MSTFSELFRAARQVSTPLIAIRTPDPALTQRTILEMTKDQPLKPDDIEPVLAWDCINGILGINDDGKLAAKKLVRDGNNFVPANQDNSVNATEALVHALNLPRLGMLLMSNAHRGTMPDQNPNWIQACWNLRESLKSRAATVVLLGPDFDFPPELAQDIMIQDEPLPNEEELKRIILKVFDSVGVDKPEPAIVEKAVDATCGLASFPAEQVAAMSLKRDKETKVVSMNIDALWERKRQMIEQTPGLSVWRGREKFSDIGGLSNAKEFFSLMLAGNETPRAIVFVDEIEKAFGGATSGSSDSSGVSQGFLGTILSEMQDQDYTGIICVGPPGAGKSQLAKCVGSEGAIPTISLDLGAMKGSLVGSSERSLRSALRVIRAVSQGRSYWIATSNKVSILPPELRRRFADSCMFFDLPNEEERSVIWPIYRTRFGIAEGMERPDDTDWTGAEIRTCCRTSYRLKISLVEASRYIVPVAKSGEDQIRELRNQANGKFISASYAGMYKHQSAEIVSNAARAIMNVPEE